MESKSFLGFVKLFMRVVLLKPNDNMDEPEKALVGNTILVSRHSPEMIATELPPREANQASYFNVVYRADASEHAWSKLNKLTIDRQEYLNAPGYEQSDARCLQSVLSMLLKPTPDCQRSAFLPAYCEGLGKWKGCNISRPMSADQPQIKLL